MARILENHNYPSPIIWPYIKMVLKYLNNFSLQNNLINIEFHLTIVHHTAWLSKKTSTVTLNPFVTCMVSCSQRVDEITLNKIFRYWKVWRNRDLFIFPNIGQAPKSSLLICKPRAPYVRLFVSFQTLSGCVVFLLHIYILQSWSEIIPAEVIRVSEVSRRVGDDS